MTASHGRLRRRIAASLLVARAPRAETTSASGHSSKTLSTSAILTLHARASEGEERERGGIGMRDRGWRIDSGPTDFILKELSIDSIAY